MVMTRCNNAIILGNVSTSALPVLYLFVGLKVPPGLTCSGTKFSVVANCGIYSSTIFNLQIAYYFDPLMVIFESNQGSIMH